MKWHRLEWATCLALLTLGFTAGFPPPVMIAIALAPQFNAWRKLRRSEDNHE